VSYKPITGTFLDEITYDIPSQNWGPEEWASEFDTFVEAGIDTVVLIRGGCGPRLACPSEAISSRVPTLPVYQDVVQLFLDLAGPRDIRFYMGLYDSDRYWVRYDWRKEVEVNLAFIEEVAGRYANAPAFAGWYLPHETSDSSNRVLDINTTLAGRIRELSDRPILISPYWMGRADFAVRGEPRTLEEHVRVLDEVLERYAGLVDQCAFQDATAGLLELEALARETRALADRHGIELWSNTETFDRDMPLKFPPTDWRKLAHRLDAVQDHVEKIITFEFSHFLSPNSTWPAAAALYRRYREFLDSRNSRR
jgi:Domain of unknown function (DUF5109)/Domain of unknown function (DUF4434)